MKHSYKKQGMNNQPQKREKTDWGGSAQWYVKLLEEGGTYQREVILPHIIRQLGNITGKQILDLACGPGFFSKELWKQGARVIGVDASKELIDAAKRAIKESEKIRFVASTAHELQFIADETIDTIICILAIQNIENVDEVLKECARVLKPQGRFLIVMNHPTFRVPKESGWGYDEAAQVQFRRIDKYLSESKEKIFMHPGEKPQEYTWSFHRPLQFYFKSFKKNGFAVLGLEEWISNRKSEKGPRAEAEDRSRKEIPLFLFVEVVKTC